MTAAPALVETFTYRRAFAPAFTAAVVGVVAIETVVFHLLLRARFPAVAWTATALSVLTLAWLVADARAFARGALRLDADAVHVALGRRWTGAVPRAAVVRAFRPSWRDLPASGDPARAEYANLTAPATPNVLLVLRAPAPLRFMRTVTRSVSRVGVHVDAPDAFVAALAPEAGR